MCGEDDKRHDMFSYIPAEQRVPADNLLRDAEDGGPDLEHTDDLYPAERLFDSFTLALTDRIASVLRGGLIDGARPIVLFWATCGVMFIRRNYHKKKLKLSGLKKVGWLFTFVAAAYDPRRPQKPQAHAMA